MYIWLTGNLEISKTLFVYAFKSRSLCAQSKCIKTSILFLFSYGMWMQQRSFDIGEESKEMYAIDFY